MKHENKMHSHNIEVKGTSTKRYNHAKNVSTICATKQNKWLPQLILQ